MISKILLVGPMPPPLGGISVYMQRLADKIGESCAVFDTAAPTFKSFMSFLKINRHTTVHYNSSNWIAALPFLLYTKLRGGRFVRNTHGFWQVAEQLSKLKRYFTRLVIKGSDTIICVSEKDRDAVIAYGAKPHHIYVIPAFLPPSNEVLEKSKTFVPECVWDEVNSSDIVLTANAGHLVFDSDNNDLYGLDMCIRLAAFLGHAIPDKKVRLLFFLSEHGNVEQEYLSRFKPLPPEFILVSGNVPLCTVLLQSHCFVRPTTRDGDSVSVREALHFGVPCVCSNALQRPTGVLPFESRNQDELNQKVLHALTVGNSKSSYSDFGDEILQVLYN